MERIHVVVQDINDYRAEEAKAGRRALIFVGWIVASVLFTGLFYNFVNSWTTLIWIFFGFFAIFICADLITHSKVKAYLHTFLAGLFLLVGILLIIVSFAVPDTLDATIMGIVLGAIFVLVGLLKIKKYTNLFRIIFKR